MSEDDPMVGFNGETYGGILPPLDEVEFLPRTDSYELALDRRREAYFRDSERDYIEHMERAG